METSNTIHERDALWRPVCWGQTPCTRSFHKQVCGFICIMHYSQNWVNLLKWKLSFFLIGFPSILLFKQKRCGFRFCKIKSLSSSNSTSKHTTRNNYNNIITHYFSAANTIFFFWKNLFICFNLKAKTLFFIFVFYFIIFFLFFYFNLHV